MVGIRLVTAHGETTRRIDLQLVGSRGLAVEDGLVTTFEAGRLWQTIRDLLPPLDQLTADPAGRRPPEPAQVPGPGWDRQCRAMVSLAVVATGGGEEADRTAARSSSAPGSPPRTAACGRPRPCPTARPTSGARPKAPWPTCSIWDVTGALEALVARAAS